MDNNDDVVDRLDKEYDRTTGFVGMLRAGVFDPDGAQRLLQLLQEIELAPGPIDRRLVQLLWYLPLILQWQCERLVVRGGDPSDLEEVRDQVTSRLEELFGVP